MTDVPPDNGASGLPPAAPLDPPVVRRSTFSPPPPGAEPPTFDDDLLADAMAAEVATYTSPITLPKLPAVPEPAAQVPPAFAAPAPQAAPPTPAPVPPTGPAANAPATTWDGRPVAEEAAAPAVASAPEPTPPPIVAPTFSAPWTATVDDGEPSEEELRRALGGASTLETIERLEKELKHISNGEPTILPVATPAAGMNLGVAASTPAEQVQAEPERQPEPAASAPAPQLAETATTWPFPPPGEPDPAPALDHPAPGHFFPSAFEPIHPDAAPEPSIAHGAAAELPVVEPPAAEPAAADVASFPVEPAISAPTALPELPEPSAPPVGDAPSFAGAGEPLSVTPPVPTPAPAVDPDPLAWLAPPAGSTFPPPPEAPTFSFDPPAGEVPAVTAPAAEAAESLPEPAAPAPIAAEFPEPDPVATEPVATEAAEPVVPQPAAPEPLAPASPDPSSYAPYPFEVDPSLIDPVAAATLLGPDAAPVVEASSPVETVPPEPEPATAPETPWWAVAEPADGGWDLAAPPEAVAPVEVAPPPQVAAPEVQPAALEVQPAAPNVQLAVPDAQPALPDAVDPAPAFGFPTPYSTEPPVGPESPDWLSAPPPVFTPPELVEPPGFVDSPPNAALDPVAPITANTMASLPKPMPTDQPNIADRAELPPPPGYEDIPIRSSEEAAPAEAVGPDVFFPAPPALVPVAAPVAAPPVVIPPAPTFPSPDAAAAIAAPPAATVPSGLDHEDDDVIDEVDRVTGTGAIPISSVGTIEPLAPPSEPIATIRLGEGQPALVDEQPKEPPAFEVETAGPEPTPLDMRAGRAARLFWLWFAANSSVLSMGLGAVLLATGMSLRQSIVATLAGVAISFLPLGLGTLAGKWSGQPTMIVSRAAFGHAGNILPALLAVLTRVLWGGVLLWLLATAVAQILVGAGLDAGLGTTVWQLVGLVAGFVIATVIAVFGYGFVAKLQLFVSIVSGLLILGSAALTYQHLDFSKALTVPDGNWILVVSGAALVFSVVGLAWVHSSSDLARYQRTGSSGAASMLWATFGATLPPFLLVVWGAMLAASDPALGKKLTTNPLAAIASLLPAWYPAPLLVFAALGLLSGAVVTMYSGGFALQALGLKLRRNLGTLISAILVLAVSAALIFVVTDFSSLVRGLIITIAVPVAAWAGIFAAEMMIRTRRFHTPSLLAPGGIYPQLRPLNFLALIIISVIGLGLVSSNIPGLEWEGFLFGLAGIGPKDLWASSDAGVFVALLLGILVPLVGGIPSIRRQERASVVSEPVT